MSNNTALNIAPYFGEETILSRVWAMPNKWTFKIMPIFEFIIKYQKMVGGDWFDPFAGQSKIADHSNDISWKGTTALEWLGFFSNLGHVIFDPPYSLEQCKRSYNGAGLHFGKYESQNCVRWTEERNLIAEKQSPGGIVLSFGWSSTCMGKKRGYKIIEILLVSHGSARPDTICVAEVKL